LKRRLLGALTAGSLLVGLVAVPSFAAQGGIERYQTGTTAYQINVLGTYIHDWVVTSNPCDGSIAITGSTTVGGNPMNEIINATLTNGVITFTSTYDGYVPEYTWSGSFPVGGGDLSGQYTGTVVAAPTQYTTYKNHGEYVASMGGGADAAHSCIGMPKVSGAADAANANTAEAAAVKADLLAIKARLLATLQAVAARLQADGHANANAVDAVQKHVQVLTDGTSGLDRAAAGAGNASQAKPDKPSKPTRATSPTKPAKPALPAQAKGHPNGQDHPSKP
jgi:hypothetical protein